MVREPFSRQIEDRDRPFPTTIYPILIFGCVWLTETLFEITFTDGWVIRVSRALVYLVLAASQHSVAEMRQWREFLGKRGQNCARVNSVPGNGRQVWLGG